MVYGSAISAGYWKEECLRLRLHNLLTFQVSVLSGLPSCRIHVEKFQGFSLGQRTCLSEGYAGDFVCLFVSLHSISFSIKEHWF